MTNTDSEQTFGTGVTPPHRPKQLTSPTYGKETHRMYGEVSHRSFGEQSLRKYGEGLISISIESEITHQQSRIVSEGQTSAFIVGEDHEERYRCDICGKDFDSKIELERHVRRVGIVE